MPENRMLSLLEQGDWESDAALIQGLQAWPLYPLLLETYESLQEDALYKSRVHGSGHIHRVLLFAALIAWQEALPEDLVRQLFRAAAYHDVGRTFDGYDLDHGARSAQRLEELTGQTGEALAELQAAVTAHALPDARLEETVHAFHPADFDRAVELTRLLKDADNLDRVRLGDLKVKFLRHESAKNLADFALRLLARDQLWKERGKE
ncbi:MAG: HD domain-containing protein [Ruminiclostridium sp.]|jgi:hypothetical protein|nr:HD domain-containing protein [Ruminiclostridium sp.]MCI9465957.1 HD domain-containing protein [Ruminiclostridium sp.]